MRVLGISLEAPFDGRSWSGSSRYFFTSLKERGILADARQVKLSPWSERLYQLRAFALPRHRWQVRYHASEARFRALSALARQQMDEHTGHDAVVQIGARLSCHSATSKPIFGYHDSNAAQRYQYFDRELIDPASKRAHLAWEADVYAGMSGILVMSSWLASSFMRDFNVPPDKLHVVGAGINFETLPDVPPRHFDAPHFLFVGKEFERKGGRFLLDAFSRVRRALPNARLTIVGPARPAQSPDGVTFAGFLSKGDPTQSALLTTLFETCTALVLPSVYEPFGISLIEGMAYGLPCITVDRCAMPEIVADRQTGLVARPEDADSLADAMIAIGADSAMAESMGSAGRRRVEHDFTWDVVAKRIESVLGNEVTSA